MCALLLSAGAAIADPVVVPSGQAITFVDVITDTPGPAGETWRYRFLAPSIARDTGVVSGAALIADIDAICSGFVVPDLVRSDARPDQVIISLADRPVEFGVANPDATQVFEAYRIDGQTCLWEGF